MTDRLQVFLFSKHLINRFKLPMNKKERTTRGRMEKSPILLLPRVTALASRQQAGLKSHRPREVRLSLPMAESVDMGGQRREPAMASVQVKVSHMSRARGSETWKRLFWLINKNKKHSRRNSWPTGEQESQSLPSTRAEA